MFEIDTEARVPSVFGKQISEYESSRLSNQTVTHSLSFSCRQEIADASDFAIVLDMRPLDITENMEGMTAFAESIFKVGQSMPIGVAINQNSYLPCRTTIDSSLVKLA